MLKILQARLQQYMNWTENFQLFKLDLEKAEELEIKLPTSAGSSKKQESSRKISTSALLTMPKLWQCGSQQSVEDSSRDGNNLPPEKSWWRSRNNSWNWTWTNRFQIRKALHQGWILSPCLFHLYAVYIMQKAGLVEPQAWIKIDGKNITSDM